MIHRNKIPEMHLKHVMTHVLASFLFNLCSHIVDINIQNSRTTFYCILMKIKDKIYFNFGKNVIEIFFLLSDWQ